MTRCNLSTGNFVDVFLEARLERILRLSGSVREAPAEDVDGFIRQLLARRAPSPRRRGSRARLLEKLQKEMPQDAARRRRVVDDEPPLGHGWPRTKPPPSNQDQLKLLDAKLAYTPNPILSGSLTLPRPTARGGARRPTAPACVPLLKSIAEPWTWSPARAPRCDDRVKLGVFSQDLAQYLPKDASCLEYVMDVARQDDPLMREEKRTSARSRGHRITCGRHGAAQNRLSVWRREGSRRAGGVRAAAPQLLLLDEPSNHLDVGAVKALTDGLQGWDGRVCSR